MHKNKLVTEKMALENELNKSVLTSIKSQMNPHFFYNALNTIQSYIFINDKKNASTYLSKFSKLTRLILEMSEKEYLRIGEEIEGLQLYLSLEKMRFEDNLSYSIEVAPEIDVDLYKVPPMLIQPYVENAIKHGLLHIKTERKLQLTFSLKGQGFLEVVIDDNGIGRQRSAVLNQYKAGQHQSFANKANETRLAILNKDSLNKLGIEIIDKQNEVGEALGTRVVLQIPIY
jgi:LytS/YehU family sensor histidine kinase